MTTSIARRTRSTLALVAGAALLGLAACGTDGGDEATAPPAGGSEVSDGGEQDQQDQPMDDQAPSDGGGATGDGEEEATQDEGGTAALGERTRIMLVTDLGIDDTSGDGPLTLQNEELAELLAAPFEATAECADELVLEPGNTAGCVGPAGIEKPEPTQEWVANAVRVPQADDPAGGSQDAVLFSTGTALPEGADDLLDEDITLTGLGFGSAFGMEPLSAEQLAESTLQTLTSEHAYIPVGEMAEWSEVTCEDSLDFTQFETVDCEATTTDGESWDLSVAPGSYVNNDQGLLVGIESQRNG